MVKIIICSRKVTFQELLSSLKVALNQREERHERLRLKINEQKEEVEKALGNFFPLLLDNITRR